MNFFGNYFNRSTPENYTPKTGIARYLEVFWDHMGKLLGMNLMCFAAFLPAAMGLSFGMVFQNFWLTCLGGLVGGFLFCPVFLSSLSVSLCCYLNAPMSWFTLLVHQLKAGHKRTALEGAVFGGIAGCLLAAGQFFWKLVEIGSLPAPIIWLCLCLDFFLLALLFVLLELPLAVSIQPVKQRLHDGLFMVLMTAPVRICSAALVLLLWCALGISLFPVSIPFAVVVGFWPLLLLLAQLWLPVHELSALEELAVKTEPQQSPGKPKRRNLGLILGILVAFSILLGIVQFRSAYQKPDIQIAVVHSEALPDSVCEALEASLEALVGDRNGDGTEQVLLNDYVVSFDGSAADMDVQTAGMTRLITDLNARDSCIYIVEDADGFLSAYADLMNTEQTHMWSQLSVLSGLDAGTYSDLDAIQQDLYGQALLSDYLVIPTLECPHDLISLLLK